jgi:hypothetical protein
VGSFTTEFEKDKNSSRNGASLCEGALCGEPGGELLYWGPWRISNRRLWRWTSLFIRVPLFGNTEGRSFPRGFERRKNFLYLGEFL